MACRDEPVVIVTDYFMPDAMRSIFSRDCERRRRREYPVIVSRDANSTT